ncbi:MAG: hypothetical protein ACJZ59_05530 [Candidatus Thalassarchaeaceae archaeon]
MSKLWTTTLVLIVYFMMTNVMIFGLAESTLDIFSSFRANHGWSQWFHHAFGNWTDCYCIDYHATLRWCQDYQSRFAG